MNEIGIIEFDYENNVICIYQEKEWHDYSTSELKDYLNDIQSQLATYKDKEDKLREYCRTETFEDIYTYIDDNVYVNPKPIFNDILQILNEGGKK